MAQKKVNYPLVGVIMGSTSDWETMREACEVLAGFSWRNLWG